MRGAKIKKFFSLFLFFIYIWAQEEPSTEVERKKPIYKKAPNFTLMSIEKEKVSLDSLFKKGPLFMSFWALWCKACIKELDALMHIHKQYESLGFQVVGISTDGPRAINKVKSFVKSKKWPYKILLDIDGKIKELYNVKVMPTSFLIDQEGNIRYTAQGFKKGDEKKIQEKIKEIFRREE